MQNLAPIVDLSAVAYTIPTDAAEADGTLAWSSTTLVVAHVEAGGMQGLGYTYADATNARLIEDTLADAVCGLDAFDIPACTHAMQRAVRNIGRGGLAATAISAVDTALWDLKAKLLDQPLARLLGAARDEVAVYGSGGFTSYEDGRLQDQLAGWVAQGCHAVKMKIGTDPDRDLSRVRAGREAAGKAQLFVDANGAYGRKQAQAFARQFAELGVTWFEEPVSSDDLEGLRLLRNHMMAPMELAAGEYSYTLDDVRRMLESGAVDVQQADASRCGGISGFLAAANLCDAFHTDLSAHCAPALHLHVACAAPRLRHLEWFHDHARIEHMLFDGAPAIHNGTIRPDLSRPGLGLDFKQADAAGYEA